MQNEDKIEYLLDLAESLGIALRRAPASAMASDHPGGALVRLKGQDVLFLDSSAPLTEQLAATAAALAGRPELEDMFLPPEIRMQLDTAREAS